MDDDASTDHPNLSQRRRYLPRGARQPRAQTRSEAEMTPTQDNATTLRGAYDQLRVSYRAIDDFRANLLGFLPLVTGGGFLLLTGSSNGFAWRLPVSADCPWDARLFPDPVASGNSREGDKYRGGARRRSS